MNAGAGQEAKRVYIGNPSDGPRLLLWAVGSLPLSRTDVKPRHGVRIGEDIVRLCSILELIIITW